jgi:hypothetical protein
MSRTFLRSVLASVVALVVAGTSVVALSGPDLPDHVSAQACCRKAV